MSALCLVKLRGELFDAGGAMPGHEDVNTEPGQVQQTGRLRHVVCGQRFEANRVQGLAEPEYETQVAVYDQYVDHRFGTSKSATRA